jgi:thiamine-monophosphate kinase
VNRPPGEFELIERLVTRLGKPRRAILGPGDDCAILRPTPGRQLLTIDSVVEGIHFRLAWGTPEDLGARALTVNLSDIAAMGGVPTVAVVNLAVRAGLGAAFFERMYKGMGEAAAAAGVEVVGGNVTRARDLAITVALLGEVRGTAMRRDTARPGDAIYVTGTLGDAAAGLRILSGRLRTRGAARRFLIGRLLRPTARMQAGRRLARIRPTPAAIDISDGLWRDLGHILERSEAGAEIDPAALPLSEAYRAVVGDDPALALGGGDDYELLFCLRHPVPAPTLSRRLGIPATQIGRVTSSRSATLVGPAGERGRRIPKTIGWDQLRSRPGE